MQSLDSTAKAVFRATDDLISGSIPEIGSGGGTWLVVRKSADSNPGNGVMGPPAAPEEYGVTGVYFMRADDPRLAATGAGTRLSVSEWYMVAPLGTDLQVPDLLVSVDDPGIGFRLTSIETSLSEGRLEGTADAVSTAGLL